MPRIWERAFGVAYMTNPAAILFLQVQISLLFFRCSEAMTGTPTPYKPKAPAFAFLQKNGQEIERARAFGADNFLFDFGIAPPQQLQTAIYLPPELIEIMARFEMGIVFSVIQVSRG